jgi:hypothetical protein
MRVGADLGGVIGWHVYDGSRQLAVEDPRRMTELHLEACSYAMPRGRVSASSSARMLARFLLAVAGS